MRRPATQAIVRACVASLALLIAALAQPQRSHGLSEGNLRIAVSGDTHGYNIAGDPALEGRDLLGGVRAVLGKANVYVFNHEGTLIADSNVAANCREFDNQSTFATAPSFAQRIDVPGVTVVATLANNHAMDCGAAGLSQTIAAFSDAGIQTLGAGDDLAAACRPLEITVNGVRLAFVSYLHEDPGDLPDEVAATPNAPGVATFDGCDVQHDIDSLSADVVIVMLHAHWGASWEFGVADEQTSAVADLLSWGADIVVSSGPHYPQGVSTSGKLAFMGLGDFMFHPDYTLPTQARRSIMPLIDIERGAVAAAWLYPAALDGDGLPQLQRGEPANDLIALVDDLSRDLGGAIVPLDGLALARPEPAARRKGEGQSSKAYERAGGASARRGRHAK
jgi:poly-gamma-glutamate synthesis protein (capsule biosynthesis protein)